METWKRTDRLETVRGKVNGNLQALENALGEGLAAAGTDLAQAQSALTGQIGQTKTALEGSIEQVRLLAAGKPEVVFGSYAGAYAYSNPTSTHITLGKKPLGVIIMPKGGTSPNSGGRSYGGILALEYPIMEAGIADNTGFTVCNEDGSYVNLNQTGKVYYYLALV